MKNEINVKSIVAIALLLSNKILMFGSSVLSQISSGPATKTLGIFVHLYLFTFLSEQVLNKYTSASLIDF